MATKEYEALKGDEFRIMCPKCGAMWSTHSVPSECGYCRAVVTFRCLPEKK